MTACPKCGYVRKATDVAPDWQCPSCGIAYEKFGTELHGHAHNFEPVKKQSIFDTTRYSHGVPLPTTGADGAIPEFEKEIISTFQERREETWRIIRPWTFVCVPAFAALFLMAGLGPKRPETLWELNLFFGDFLVVFITVGRISFAVQKYYRCPACGKVPNVRGGGVLVNPAVCPNCSVLLK